MWARRAARLVLALELERRALVEAVERVVGAGRDAVRLRGPHGHRVHRAAVAGHLAHRRARLQHYRRT